MTRYLSADDLRHIAKALGEPAVRDEGLLGAAAHRPQVSAGGQDAYPTLHLKAAALLDGIIRNHLLIDGNKRLGWVGIVVFYRLNGYAVHAPTDPTETLVMAVADQHLPLDTIADTLAEWVSSD